VIDRDYCITMLFTNGRLLRNLITPLLLAHSRRSLQTRNSLSTRLNTTLSSRNESSLTTTNTSTPLHGTEPKLSLTFTCTVVDCGKRSTHQFTKRAYQKGVVLVECPGCKNRYVIIYKYIYIPGLISEFYLSSDT
jgi:hypothetical protein